MVTGSGLKAGRHAASKSTATFFFFVNQPSNQVAAWSTSGGGDIMEDSVGAMIRELMTSQIRDISTWNEQPPHHCNMQLETGCRFMVQHLLKEN